MTMCIFISVLVLFVAAAVSSVVSIHSDGNAPHRLTQVLFYTATVLLGVLGILAFPVHSLHGLLSVSFWIWGYFYIFTLLLALLLVYLHLSRWKEEWGSISAIILPLIAAIFLISIPFFDSTRKFSVVIDHSLLPLHILLAILGELFFFLGFAASVLYLVMSWQLRKKTSMKFVYRLPSLETLARFQDWSMVRSFISLTAGLVVGILLVLLHYDMLFLGSPKEIMIYISWGIILAIVLLKRKTGVNEFTISIATIVAFVLVLTLFLTSSILITTGFHTFK